MISDFYYPLKLSSFPKETIWGGDKLSKKFNKSDFDSLGETWELTVRENEKNIIMNGPLAGLSLNEYIDRYTDLSSKEFPVLIKFIDAADKLSVQVHPNDSYAKHVGEKNGKTEMWYIIEAEENASIVYGVSQDPSQQQLQTAMLNGDLDRYLNKTKVSAGDVYFIPGGLVHAIGKGILLAEIQQNSDTTYRFYDYDRKDRHGNKRELHIEKALGAFTQYTEDEIEAIRFSKSSGTNNGTLLASCEHFTVAKHTVSNLKSFNIDSLPFLSLLCTSGSGIIRWKNGNEAVKAGDSFYIPQELGSFDISGQLELLLTTV